MYLDRLVCDIGQHLGSVQLGHGVVRIGRRALIGLPGCLECQQFRRFKLHLHLGQFETDALKAANKLSELLTLGRPVGRVLQCAVSPAETHRRHLQPGSTQPLVSHIEALVLSPQHLRCPNPTVVEFEDAVVITAVGHAVISRAHGESGRSLIHQK